MRENTSQNGNKAGCNQVKKRNSFIKIFENFTRSYVTFILFLMAFSTVNVFSQTFIKDVVDSDDLASNQTPPAEKKIFDENISFSDIRPENKNFSPTDGEEKEKSFEVSPEEAFRKFMKEKSTTFYDSTKRVVEDEKEFLEIELEDKDEAEIEDRDKFHWKPALIQSVSFLGIQHGFRMIQIKTRRELKGPFFNDWGKSIRSLRGWRDGDSWRTNYLAHPLQGSVTGRIFINNSDRARRQEFGKSKEYWESRFKAMLWSTIWSTQFELGPLSEATIGNVGLRKKNGYSTMAYVDLVITPTVGTGVVVGEDAIDKYILKNWFERKSGRLTTKIKILRSVLTPTTAFTNLLNGKVPWKRFDR